LFSALYSLKKLGFKMIHRLSNHPGVRSDIYFMKACGDLMAFSMRSKVLDKLLSDVILYAGV
jgi:hypothetical protein